MRRIQLHLDEELDDALGREALARGLPKAAVIREFLAERVGPTRATEDPSQALIGIYDGRPEESQELDEVLYGP